MDDEWMDGVPPVTRCLRCGQAVPVWRFSEHRHERHRRGILDWIVIGYLWAGSLLALFIWALIFALVILYGSGG